MMMRMWREIKLLAATKPVIASMSDVAASRGYYMAMAADVIIAENLTLTGSIGIVTGKINLGKLFEYIGFNKEIISRGRYAELVAADHQPFRDNEAEHFAKRAQDMYTCFVDKEAFSRSMPAIQHNKHLTRVARDSFISIFLEMQISMWQVEKMDEVAQGRVWTGHGAASLGLIDAIGGLSRAVAIAKMKANLPLEKQVTLVELSRSSPSPQILRNIRNAFVGADEAVKDIIHEMASSDAIQARMEDILFEKLEGASYAKSALTLIKDYLRPL